MIGALKGRVYSLAPGKVSVETAGGWIVEAHIPVSHFTRLREGEPVLLHTVLKVRDEDLVLYGFLEPREKQFFEKLLAVSGVGGKTALSCLSSYGVDELIAAINSRDVDSICAIPGIGRKTSQRIILELTGKLTLESEVKPEAESKLRDDLTSGLVNLGYSPKAVKDVVAKILKEHPERCSFQEAFKLALKRISRL